MKYPLVKATKRNTFFLKEQYQVKNIRVPKGY